MNSRAARPLTAIGEDKGLAGWPCWSDAIGDAGASPSPRFRRAGRCVVLRLMLHLGIDLGPEQDDNGRDPWPGHEADDGSERAIGFIEFAEVGRVEGERS